jgi:WD40 repeat protein
MHYHACFFLADGKHVVSGGFEGKIRKWRLEDGQGVGKPMEAGSGILDLAVTQDGRWIVCGTRSGEVIIWDANTNEKVTKFKANDGRVHAVDVSSDRTKIAIGGDDKTFSVWSFPVGERLIGPFKHKNWVDAVKFSPDGRRIATATLYRDSVRIYDDSGLLGADFPIRVNSGCDQSLTWASDSNRLFALSKDGHIHCLDVSTKKTLAKWRIHSDDEPRCISLAGNDKVIAASAHSSVSLWDTTTHHQIRNVIHYSHFIKSMAISPSYDIATAGNSVITLRNLYDILPSTYSDNVSNDARVRSRPSQIVLGRSRCTWSKSGA